MKQISSKSKILKNLFGVGDAGFSFMTMIETSFFLIFLTDVAHLTLAGVAMISTLSGIFDTISTILAGVIVDKSSPKHGKYRSWLLYGPPFVIVFFALQFTKVGTDFTAALVICVGFVINHFIRNIARTANRSLVGVLTDDPTERAHLSGRISAGSSMGKLCASKFVLPMSLAFASLFTQNGEIWGYTLTAAVGATLMLIGYYVHYFITKGYDLPKPRGEKGKKLIDVEKVSVLDMLKSVFATPPLIAIVFHDCLRLIGYYSLIALIAYYSKIMFLENSAPVISTLLPAFNLGTLFGSLLSEHVVAKFGTRMSAIIGMAGCSSFTVAAYFCSGSRMTVIVLIFVSQVFFGVAYGLTTSFYTNCATYSEQKSGKNTKGVIMSLCSFSIKVSIVIRGLVITTGLGIIGYSAEAAITGSVASGMTILCFIVPAIFIAAAIIPLLFYKLSDKEVMEMGNEIALRKKAAIEKAESDDQVTV